MGAQASDPLGVSGIVLDGKFVVEKAIGEGGAAVVYRGHHTSVGGPVAIKFLITLSQVPEHERAVVFDEFRREGSLISELSARSSAIVQPRDMGVLERPGQVPMPYLVLEWLDGRTLDEVIVGETNSGTSPRSLAETCQLLEPVAGALAIAHERGVAHRDVKPENIFVVERAQGQPGSRIKLLDFGIAKIMRRRVSGVHQTGTLPTAFTPHYGAPEQFSRTFGETGAWSDVFAMALVILEVMRGGRRAMDGDDYVDLCRQSCAEERRPTPQALRLPVSDEVEAVFARALAVQPMHRYQSMGAFWSALLGAVSPESTGFPLTGPSAAAAAKMHSAPPPPAPVRSSGGSRKIIIVAAIGGLLMIVAASIVAGKRVASNNGSSAPSAQESAPQPSASASTSARTEATVAPTEVLCPADSVTVSGGRFKIGSGAGISAEDGPRHGVLIDTFCLDKKEVTARAYQACIDAGSCSTPSAERVLGSAARCTIGKAELADHPANCVTFDEAATFCAFRGMRLPSESEWEVAATRGGELPWQGDGPNSERANLEPKDGFEFTAPVGSFPKGASRDGIVDLVGNVAEWQGDWFGPYPSDDVSNPRGPASGTKRVVRGGAWSGLVITGGAAAPPKLTVTHRDALAADQRSASVGLRCAKELKR